MGTDVAEEHRRRLEHHEHVNSRQRALRTRLVVVRVQCCDGVLDLVVGVDCAADAKEAHGCLALERLHRHAGEHGARREDELLLLWVLRKEAELRSEIPRIKLDLKERSKVVPSIALRHLLGFGGAHGRKLDAACVSTFVQRDKRLRQTDEPLLDAAIDCRRGRGEAKLEDATHK